MLDKAHKRDCIYKVDTRFLSTYIHQVQDSRKRTGGRRIHGAQHPAGGHFGTSSQGNWVRMASDGTGWYSLFSGHRQHCLSEDLAAHWGLYVGQPTMSFTGESILYGAPFCVGTDVQEVTFTWGAFQRGAEEDMMVSSNTLHMNKSSNMIKLQRWSRTPQEWLPPAWSSSQSAGQRARGRSGKTALRECKTQRTGWEKYISHFK